MTGYNVNGAGKSNSNKRISRMNNDEGGRWMIRMGWYVINFVYRGK